MQAVQTEGEEPPAANDLNQEGGTSQCACGKHWTDHALPQRSFVVRRNGQILVRLAAVLNCASNSTLVGRTTRVAVGPGGARRACRSPCREGFGCRHQKHTRPGATLVKC